MTNIIQKNSIIIFILITVLLFVFHLYTKKYISFFRIHVQHYSNVQIRIYCIILTTPKYFDTRARAVNLTWAPRCDKYNFISEYSNDTKGLPIAPIAKLISPGYDHLTQKTTLALHYVYEKFLNDIDWIVKADDDTYIFVDNLKNFLQKQNTTQPVTFGYNFKINVDGGYHSGGGGYVLSKEALKRFYEAHHQAKSICSKDGGSEDVEIASCLRRKGVYIGKSTDENNRERFHPLTFSNHYIGPIPDALHTYAQNKPVAGLNCCSNTTISFHYVTPEHQYLIDKMHYGFNSKK